ncbi:MAG TPA: hypothetical protein VNS02_03080 [Rhizobiaceae bacterium]|nr:hypothetical protein [Rhizobiaceae bacterium]
MKRFAAALAVIVSGAQVSHAADNILTPAEVPLADEHRGWALQVTPYMWAAGLNGRMSPFRNGPTIGVEKSFSDVLNNLNFGGFVNIWGRYDRFVISGDVMYVDTSDSHAIGPLPPPITGLDARVDTKQFMAALQGGYRLLDTQQFTLDALAGLRFWHISNRVTVSALGLSTSYGESFGWVDPIVGARAFLPLTKKLSLQAQADIGGFGVGADFTWSALATLNYAFSDHFSGSAGYKMLGVNYRRGGHVFDARLSGPVMGLTYRF